LALGSGGTVRAWGYNGAGELGDGTTTNRTTSVAVRGLRGVRLLAPGSNSRHNLAIGRRKLPTDFDGDARTDRSLYRQSTGEWIVRGSTSGETKVKYGNGTDDIPVVGNYDGDT
jgi:hypothetical protein